MKRTVTESVRPGLLVRLGHIILIQVLFVFAALALIIFYPEREVRVRLDHVAVRQQLQNLAGGIIDFLDESGKGLGEVACDDVAQSSLVSLVGNDNSVGYAEIYFEDDNNRISSLLLCGSREHSLRGRSLEDPVPERIDEKTIRAALAQPAGSLIPHSFSSTHWVYHYPFVVGDSLPALLVSVTDHDLLVSNKSSLKYALFLLFLCSVLVSLLIVYLLSTRLKDPLKRLHEGLRKTTEGELFYMIEAGGDGYVNCIAESFNKMSQTLWDDQQKLRRYNELLEDAWLAQVESQRFLATVIDNSPCSIIAASADGEIVIFNCKAAEMFGYDIGEPVGKKIGELFTQPVSDGERRQGNGSPEPGCEVVCRRKDSSLFPAFLVVAPIKDRDGQVAARLFMTLDISESKSFQEMMIRIDRYYTRGKMAGDIAHEINNYLAVLSGNIELMPLFMKKGDQEKIDKKLALMKDTVDRIARFADGLADVGAGEAVFEQADINQLIQNLLAFLKPQNRFDGIEFMTDLSVDLPLAEVDVAQIQQVLVNLVTNAADALEDNTDKKIWISSHLVSHGREARCRVEVRDNGPGVPEDRVDILFQQRFTTKRKGHGYELVTCRKIMETHRGCIGYSRADGALFYFEFPVKHKTVPGKIEQAVASCSPIASA